MHSLMLEFAVFDVTKQNTTVGNNGATSAVASSVTNWHNVRFQLHKHLTYHTLASKKVEMNIKKI